MSYLDTDTEKPTQELLCDIRAAAQQSHMPGLGLLPFATLLVRLSQEASTIADKNLLIQRRMIAITLLVLTISVAQLVLAFLQFQSGSSNNAQSAVSVPQSVNTKADQSNVVRNNEPVPKIETPASKQ